MGDNSSAATAYKPSFTPEAAAAAAAACKPNSDGRFACPFPGCQYTLGRRYNLQRHLISHTGIKSEVCTECGKWRKERMNNT